MDIDYKFADSSESFVFGENCQIGIDCYCDNCKESKVFLIRQADMTNIMSDFGAILKDSYSKAAKKGKDYNQTFKSYFNKYLGNFELTLTCGKCNSRLFFFYVVHDGVLEKINTFPSLMQGLKEKYRRYTKLNNDRFNYYLELITGAYLYYNSNSGIGSYCYLRRCIENYVNDYILDNYSEEEAKQFIKLSFPEKIKKIKAFIENEVLEFLKPLYNILSKGIHELDEETCKKSFELLKETIEYILDDKLAKIEKEKKRLMLKKQLEEKSNELK